MAIPETRDDDAHPYRIFRAIVIAMPPLWVALIFTGFVLQSVFWSVVALAVLLPPAVFYMHLVAFTGICPQCKRQVRFSPTQDRYTTGDVYTYRCHACGITWRTHLRPGGFVD